MGCRRCEYVNHHILVCEFFGRIAQGLSQVMGAVDVKQTSEHELTLEWDSSASNDMIADSTLALITGIDKSPASVKRKLPVLQSECVSHFAML